MIFLEIKVAPNAFPYIPSLVPCVSSTSTSTFEEHSRGIRAGASAKQLQGLKV